MQWMELMMLCDGMTVKMLGMLAVSVRDMKALTVKVDALQTLKLERWTLISKGSWNLTCFLC
jgi:hypothetical protein